MTTRSVLLALAVAGLALVAPSVAAANPSCGATVKHSIKLTSDMSCPSSSGIVVGKSGITINLNGHTITGPTSSSYYGIYNDGYDKVTIENGTVRNYYDGLGFDYTTGSHIVHVTAVNASNIGIYVEYSTNSVIDHAAASGSGSYGIYLYENSHVNATNSKANGGWTYGIYDYYSLSTLDHVTANADEYGFYIDYPIVASTSKGTVYYTAENSTADHNSYAGFYVTDNYPTNIYQADLLNNTANNNGTYGFYADDNTKGKGNHATGNPTNCWHVPCK